MTQGTTEPISAEEPETGFLGAVISAATAPQPVPLPDHGVILVTTVDVAREVLSDPVRFRIPFTVSRRRRTELSESKPTPPLNDAAVAAGDQVFTAELGKHPGGLPAALGRTEFRSLQLLRDPVARSTTAALVPEADDVTRVKVANLALAWVDSLAPVITASRPPHRWTRIRRTEQAAHRDLVVALAEAGPDPTGRAAALAAGIQVPVAAGAWVLDQVARHHDERRRLRERPDRAAAVVWETLRLYPPTWLLPRIPVADETLGTTHVPAYTPVVVSPLSLGRRPDLIPGPVAGHAPLTEFDPSRWAGTGARPGAWLPFGAGHTACPGRNLAIAQLTHLARWASNLNWAPPGPVRVDTSRGLAPDPDTLAFTTHAHRLPQGGVR